MLVLYGCKRHLLDPLNPQTNLPPKVQLDKVKGFYENGRYKNQPKPVSSGNERMTAQDSTRFKDFEPQWDKTEVELLPNSEKMLIVPVVRFLNVDYNENIGFIRRLCIRVDANEDFIEANIVELVGNLTFVKANHNDIFANYKNTSISGFSGEIIGYQLDYDKVSYTEFENGTSTNTSGDLTTVFEGMCAKIFGEDGTLIYESCIGSGDSGGGGGGSGSGSSGSGSGGGGCANCPGPLTFPNYPSPTPIYTPSAPNIPYIHTPFTPRAPSGPGYTQGLAGTPNNGGQTGGGGNGGGSNNPPPVFIPFVPPPPPPMPHPGMIWISDLGWIDPPPPPTTVDNGQSFPSDVYTYDANGNIIPPPPPGVIKDKTMRNAANAKINCIYDDLIKQQNIRDLLDMFGTNLGLTLVIKAETPPATTATFRPNGQTIPINSNGQIVIYINPLLQTNGHSPLAIAKTIAHEMMHARLMALIFNVGGMNTSRTQLANVAGLPPLADVFTDYSGTPANELQNLAQHEFIALYWHADLVAMVKQFDGNRATQTQYEALAWDGLEMTERYSGFMENSLGYSDPYMNKSREKSSSDIKQARQNENPCR